MEAAAEGLIDFSKARLLDRTWWRHTRVMVTALDRRTRAKVADAGLRYHLSLVANGGLKADSFEKAQETAKERFFDLVGAWCPWEGKSYADRKAAEFRDWRQAYIDSFGVDPYDPAFQAWEAQRIAEIAADTASVLATKTEDEVLTERLQQKIMERKR